MPKIDTKMNRAAPGLLDRLPERCAARSPVDGSPVLIKRGEMGCWPFKEPGYDVDGFNAKLGVTDAQRDAMLHGSMFGFGMPGADPLVQAAMHC